jgi:glucokinase
MFLNDGYIVMNKLALGVDIGGTKIAFALVDEQGSIVAQHRLPTQPAQGVDAVVERIHEGIAHLLGQAQHPVAGIGIGCPGHVNPHTGSVRNAVNLGWQDVMLRDRLCEKIALPIYVENDARAWAAGELFAGAARGVSDFVFIAVGTGLGGSAVVNGKLLHGANQIAMEVGHLPVGSQGRRCACGRYDCGEMYVSGNGILAGIEIHRSRHPQSLLAAMPNITTAAVISAAQDGDSLARTVLHEARYTLIQIATWCAGMLNPQLILIGGGLGQAAQEFLCDGLESSVKARLLSPVANILRIVPSMLTEGAVGAASIVWMNEAQ